MEKVYYDFYPLDICGLHRELPIITLKEKEEKKAKEEAIASFVMLGDVALVNETARVLVERILPYRPDILVSIEAKGIPLVYKIADLTGMAWYVLIRKDQPKLYMEDPLTVEGKSITTGGTQRFVLDGNDIEKLTGRRVAFVDDVISTGGSRDAARRLIEFVGGQLVCEAFVLKEGDWVEDNPNLIYLGRLPIFEPALGGGWKPKG